MYLTVHPIILWRQYSTCPKIIILLRRRMGGVDNFYIIPLF